MTLTTCFSLCLSPQGLHFWQQLRISHCSSKTPSPSLNLEWWGKTMSFKSKSFLRVHFWVSPQRLKQWFNEIIRSTQFHTYSKCSQSTVPWHVGHLVCNFCFKVFALELKFEYINKVWQVMDLCISINIHPICLIVNCCTRKLVCQRASGEV